MLWMVGNVKKRRIVYAVAFVALLLAEIGIALFVHDGFIRPYFGDVLVTVLLCCLCRVAFPKGIKWLPLYVFLFAAFVEAMQYVDLVALLGWENNVILSIIMGRSFSYVDMICYGAGCLGFWALEKLCITCGSE